MKRVLRVVLNFVIVAGLVVALWPVGQTAYGWWSQHNLRVAWRSAATQETSRPAMHKAMTAQAASSRSHSAPKAPVQRATAKWPATRLIIPDIGVDVVVVQGIDAATLRRGPGHAPDSALPGEAGNCVIAGHRNMYGSWFYRVDELWPTSLIKLRTPRDTYTYRVAAVYHVADTDTSILQSSTEPNARPRLTLITCTMPHTSNRIVAVAYLEDNEDAS